MEFNTMLLHGKAVKKYQNGATVPPISQVSAFLYDSPEQMEKVFRGREPGYVYSRIGNPTVNAFEQRVCELEEGKAATACSSGMAAITAALMNILRAGDEVIAGSGLFGGTIDLFGNLESFGVRVKFVKHLTPEEIGPLVTEKTRAVFGEVIGNPGLDIADIRSVADFVHARGIPLLMDSTTATPFLARPLLLGADIVIHSSSKYINGGGNAISGVIVDGGSFDWKPERYPDMREYAKFGPFAFTAKLRNGIWRNMGGCLAPANAFLNLVGLETLGLRMERICDNARRLSRALSVIGGISVNYPMLEGNPYRALADRQLGGRGGGILTLRAGSREKAYAVMDHLRFAGRATNIGDVRTLVIHPASTIYLHSTEAQREAAGVFEDTIRVSVGIEDAEDLIRDFTEAVKSA